MNGNLRTESRGSRVECREAPAEGTLLSRQGLAAALQVSVCTVDRMVANGDIPCVRVRARVRFYLPDVIEALRKGDGKYGRKAVIGNQSSVISSQGTERTQGT